MKKRKLKGFVLPTLYLLITISIFVGVVMLGSAVSLESREYDYGVGAIQENTESVVGEETNVSSNIEAPIKENEATIGVHFYSKDDDETTQQNSLIYYENTYLPNTGVLYISDNNFEVETVFAGKVTDILDDEFFGKCIVVEHLSNLRTYYYGIDNILVSVGDELTNNTVLGTAKNNEIMNNKKSFLLEVYHNNELINPETFIGTQITNYE